MNKGNNNNETTARFDEMLEQSLGAVLSGGDTVDSCCRRHPENAGELKQLLETAVLARQTLAIEAPAEVKAAAREKVLAATGLFESTGRETSPGRKSLWSRRLVRPVAIAAVPMVLLSAGTAAASTGSGPDSVLYPLKQKLEDTRQFFAMQDLDQAKVEVGRAERRLDETVDIVDKEKPEYVPELISRFETHLESASSLALEAAEKGDDSGEVEEMIAAARERHRQILGEIEDRLPDDIRESVVPENREERSAPGTGATNPAPGPAAPAPGGAVNNRAYDSDGGNEAGGSGDYGDYGDSGVPGPSSEPGGDYNYEPPGNENGSETSGGDAHLNNNSFPYPQTPVEDND